MALILGIESSAGSCSAAIINGNTILSELTVREPQAHAARLAPLIDELFMTAGAAMKDLAAVAISAGPGSYTGLRIGASTAKGICVALGIPLIAIETLSLLAYQVPEKPDHGVLLCAMIDARRMEVYCQVFDANLQPVSRAMPRIIEQGSFGELLAGHKMLFFGDGAGKCRTVLKHPNALFLEDVYPKASALVAMAAERFKRNEFSDLAAFSPMYLKEFEAKKAQPFF